LPSHLAAVLLFAVVLAGATTSVTMDGVWWQGLSKLEKAVAVQALIDGISTEYVLRHTIGRTDTYKLFNVPTQTLLSAIQAGRVPPDSQNAPVFSKTFGIYIDELDLWYKVHSKMSMTPSHLLADCFSDKPVFEASICETLGNDTNK
jgi:hypothetical protein